MEELYLDLKELCERIKYKPQSIYNNINKGIFVKGKHYIKPSARKLLFKWSGIREFIGEVGDICDTAPLVNCETAMLAKSDNDYQKQKPKSRIKI